MKSLASALIRYLLFPQRHEGPVILRISGRDWCPIFDERRFPRGTLLESMTTAFAGHRFAKGWFVAGRDRYGYSATWSAELGIAGAALEVS